MKCSLCGAEGTNKTTCPLNPNAVSVDLSKHNADSPVISDLPNELIGYLYKTMDHKSAKNFALTNRKHWNNYSENLYYKKIPIFDEKRKTFITQEEMIKASVFDNENATVYLMTEDILSVVEGLKSKSDLFKYQYNGHKVKISNRIIRRIDPLLQILKNLGLNAEFGLPPTVKKEYVLPIHLDTDNMNNMKVLIDITTIIYDRWLSNNQPTEVIYKAVYIIGKLYEILGINNIDLLQHSMADSTLYMLELLLTRPPVALTKKQAISHLGVIRRDISGILGLLPLSISDLPEPASTKDEEYALRYGLAVDYLMMNSM